MNLKDKKYWMIIGVLVGIILILGILLATSSRNSQNSKKEKSTKTAEQGPIEIPDIQSTGNNSFSEEKTFNIYHSYGGSTATITFYPDNSCQADFTMFAGKVSMDLSNYVTYEYPPINEPCKYRIDNQKVSIYYNGMARRTLHYKNGVGQSGSQAVESFYIMQEIEYEYDKENDTLTLNNGKWKENPDMNGRGLLHFVKKGSAEDLQDQVEEEKAKAEKERLEKEREEEQKASSKKAMDQINVELTDSNQSGQELTSNYETATIRITNILGSLSSTENKPVVKSIQVNGNLIDSSQTDISVSITPNPGANQYNIVITDYYGYERNVTLNYNFEVQEPYLTIDIFESSCYLKIWSNNNQYNKLQDLQIYYDDVLLNDNPSSVKKYYMSEDPYLYLYSTSGTHTIKAKNKYGLEFQRDYTFPEKCNNQE